ncbi:MAG: TRAP transporter small permease [Gammaproteobacteria bacterium]
MPATEPHWVTSLRHSLVRLDGFMACTSLLLLLLLVAAQVVLRNLFDSGIPHADILSRYLVLYVTFFGAALAIEAHRHIRIDLVAVLVEPDRLHALRRPLYLVSAGVCVIMTWAAIRFWYDDWQYAAEHERWSSVLALITPFGFGLLSVHFLLGAVFPATREDAPP